MFMELLAIGHAREGITLRSGGAKGADHAFEAGCDFAQGPKEIFRTEDATSESMKHAAKFHPNWSWLSPIAKKLQARNSMIILGWNLDDPVETVICWTPKGTKIGGTAQGIRIAEHYGIPVANLGDDAYGFDS